MVAAGRGERMGTVLPKVFLHLAGVPLFIRTLQTLLQSSLITAVVIVVAAEYEDLCRDMVNAYGPFGRPIHIAHGGAERQDSVRYGLAALDPDCEIVVIHDAARPFLTASLVDRSIIVAAACGGAIVAVPVRDTIKRVGADTVVVETLSRQGLWQAQTPQTFSVPLIREAHARALAEGWRATDDAALVEWVGGTVKSVVGDSLNFKITTPDDWQLAEAILKQREMVR
jgi:2-C-methyl-D-erythritol 4-phosphate cytidylyltransferase